MFTPHTCENYKTILLQIIWRFNGKLDNNNFRYSRNRL